MAQFGAEYEEIGYEGTIENEDGGFTLLPEGDYDFTVNKVTRGRYEGSDRMPACNSVSVELTVWGAQDKAVITERFFLVKKFEWKLSQFFLSIGLKKHGEQLVMRWNIEGMKGKCKVYIDRYQKQCGGEGQSNKIKKFYAYDEQVQTVSPQPQSQQYSAPQQQYQQPMQSSGGWKAGSF
ncbi:MAG: DUF669 domain-containing protein [Ruminococcus sp.]|nr:DUF669 domain-containing protein [Ruminococcus sp.]